MAIRVLPLGSTKQVELSSDPDKGKPEATKFTIRCLDSKQIGWLRDKFVAFEVAESAPPQKGDDGVMVPGESIGDSEAKQHVPINEVAFATCAIGIAGWENLPGRDGKPIVFKETPTRIGGKTYQSVMPKLLSMISADDLRELQTYIDEFSKPTEAEKN